MNFLRNKMTWARSANPFTELPLTDNGQYSMKNLRNLRITS
jgi:hypothetical protein